VGLLGDALREEPQDFVVLREASLLILGEDSLFVDKDVEHSVPPANKGRVDPEALSDCGRQTGGPG
jgi:hypothetical protein